MDEIDKTIFDVISSIDIRAERDFHDALEEFTNTQDKEFFRSKKNIYLEALIKTALFELFLDKDLEDIKTFLTLALSEARENTKYFNRRNSGDEYEE